MFRTSTNFVFILLIACLFCSCIGDMKPEFPKKPEVIREGLSVNTPLYPWVEELLIRETPDLKGKIITVLQKGNAVKFLGETSKEKLTYVLKGIAYNDYWLKVATNQDTEGWIYGGAVTIEKNPKMYGLESDTKFHFEHFGKFDLSTWESIPNTSQTEGDHYVATSIYKKGSQILKIATVEVGEYGYGKVYQLLDENNTIRKERIFKYLVNTDTEPYSYELTEFINDYTVSPAKKYIKKQMVDTHFMQLNSKPYYVNGKWEKL